MNKTPMTKNSKGPRMVSSTIPGSHLLLMPIEFGFYFKAFKLEEKKMI